MNKEQVMEAILTIEKLRTDLAATQKRCNEAYGNVSALFGEFCKISGMTYLGGEVDDYEDVTKAVKQIVDDLAASRAQLHDADALHQWEMATYKADTERQIEAERRTTAAENAKLSADLADARAAAHAWKRAAKFWYFAQPDDDGEWERWQEYRYRRELFKPVLSEE